MMVCCIRKSGILSGGRTGIAKRDVRWGGEVGVWRCVFVGFISQGEDKCEDADC